jgi:hypothetical protein
MASEIGPVMQHGYIVEDVEKTAAEWIERAGVGPFYILERQAMENYYYRGKQTYLELKIAFAYWGSIQVELIQQLNDADTLYSRALRSSPGKLNHFASIVSDLDGLLARRKLESRVIHSGSMSSGVKFVYLEEFMPGGQHLELVEPSQAALMGFAGMEAVARGWDGKNPMRPMSALGNDLAALKAVG